MSRAPGSYPVAGKKAERQEIRYEEQRVTTAPPARTRSFLPPANKVRVSGILLTFGNSLEMAGEDAAPANQGRSRRSQRAYPRARTHKRQGFGNPYESSESRWEAPRAEGHVEADVPEAASQDRAGPDRREKGQPPWRQGRQAGARGQDRRHHLQVRRDAGLTGQRSPYVRVLSMNRPG